ncbi:MAG: DUF2589 domain-containing protein [Chlorobaculum sp.]|jgi:hypothetical protein|nr:DUF2589 domain-containing protein [Chlorobaculum sp.]
MAIGDELASLDFESMIGGPLNAVIKAQAQSAVTSVDFIKAVGFDTDDSGNITGPTMVTFKYSKPVETKAADGTVTVEPKDFTLTVPFLTMLPIPFIRVEETTIDFNAKITAVQESTATSEMGLNTELQAKAGWGWGSASLKVNFSYKKSTTSSEKVERTYSMAVHVRAVQDELPAGTERLLGILENCIKEVPATT